MIEDRWKCQNCGNSVPDGLTVCPKCGLVKGGFDELPKHTADGLEIARVEQKVKVEIPFVSGDCLFYYFIGHCSLYLCGNKIMKSFIYRYILYLTVVPFISCNSDLRIEGTYDFADSNDPMKSIIISEADQTGFVSIYYVMESPYSSNAEQIIFAQDRSKPDRTSDGGLLLESEWGQLIFEKPQSFVFVISSGTEINFGNAFSITALYGEQAPRVPQNVTFRGG